MSKLKQIETAGVPNGWNNVLFEDMADIIKDSCRPSRESDFSYIGLEHINQHSLSINSRGHSSEVASNKFFFRSGDILFGKLRPYFRKVYRPRFEGVCSTDIWVVRAKRGIDQGYLFYLMASNDFIDLASSGSSGTRMPRADWDHLKKVEWPVPSLDNQHAIAKILSDLDSKIELNQKMNKTLEAIGQALFKRWFVDFEFPGENGQPYKSSGGEMVESEFRGIPKGWMVKPIDKIADFLNGLALQNYPPKGNEHIPVIKIRELRQGITDSSDKASIDIDEEYIVNDGDVLFSWSGSLEVCIWCGGKGALNQHLFKVTSPSYPKWMYYYWIVYYLPEYRHIAKGKATTMGHIQRHNLSASLVLIPPQDVLNAMSRIMNPLIERIINNSTESRKLSQIRDSLLPRLMSGRIRVSCEETR